MALRLPYVYETQHVLPFVGLPSYRLVQLVDVVTSTHL